MGQKSSLLTIPSKDFPIQFPIQEAYDFEVDSLNYLFIASPGDVYRFNGYETEKISQPLEYRNSVVEGLFKDANQRIWMEAKGIGLGWIQGDSVIRYPYMSIIDSLMPYRKEAIYYDLEGQLHLAVRGLGYYKVSKTGALSCEMGIQSGLNGFVVTQLADGTPFHFSIFNPDFEDDPPRLKVYTWDQKQVPQELLELETIKPFFNSSLAQKPDGNIALSVGTEEVVTLHSDTLVNYVRLPHKVIQLFADKDTNLWVGTYLGGVYRVREQDFDHAEQLFPGTVSAAVTQDQNGGVWCKSNASMFYYLPDLSRRQFVGTSSPIEQSMVFHFTRGKKDLYCVSNKDQLLVVSEDSLHAEVIPPRFKGRVFPKVTYDHLRDWIWLSLEKGVLAKNGNTWTPFSIPEPIAQKSGRLIDLLVFEDSSLLGLTEFGLLQFHPERPEAYTLFRDTVSPKTRYQCFAKGDSGQVWIGGLRGIWVWEKGALKQLNLANEAAEIISGVPFKMHFSAGCLWVNTLKNGLWVYRNQQWKPVVDKKGKHLYVSDFVVAADGTLWGRTREAHLRMVRIQPNQATANVDYFGNQLLIGYDKISSRDAFHVVDDKVFIGVSGNIDVLPLASLKGERIEPKLVLKNVFVNHQEVPVQEHYQMPFDSNSFYFVVDKISYRLLNYSFRYRLLGWDNRYQLSDLDEIQYTNLAPGEYEFQFETQIVGGRWKSGRPIRITILTPIWQQWWFIGLMVLLSVVVIGAGFYFWYLQKHRRTTLLLEKIRAEQTALKAQMNPHFVFNALSSIQELVFSENKISAVTNIAMFARLMRKILDQSSKEVISLKEEINTLELYLQLESLRFDGKFDYTVTTAPDIVAEAQHIPPLLLQPYVENAIKHGLLNKIPKGGQLTITFTRQSSNLLCTIEDDGVGRERAANIRQNRKLSYQSFGAEATQMRIKNLNERQSENIQLSTFDLKDAEGNACGTRVELLLPITFAS
ncbi:MAG: sensor histidine kinase [Salibacteraceae bacterium]